MKRNSEETIEGGKDEEPRQRSGNKRMGRHIGCDEGSKQRVCLDKTLNTWHGYGLREMWWKGVTRVKEKKEMGGFLSDLCNCIIDEWLHVFCTFCLTIVVLWQTKGTFCLALSMVSWLGVFGVSIFGAKLQSNNKLTEKVIVLFSSYCDSFALFSAFLAIPVNHGLFWLQVSRETRS